MIVNVIEIVMFLCFEWLFIGLIVFVWVIVFAFKSQLERVIWF